jgi:hypothetical protein
MVSMGKINVIICSLYSLMKERKMLIAISNGTAAGSEEAREQMKVDGYE